MPETSPSENPKPTPLAARSPPVPPDTASDLLYENPASAVRAIHEGYLYWTGKLTESSFTLSLAVIGANWAVFGSVDRIRGNMWSEISLSMVILSLAIDLFGYWKLGGMLRSRLDYAEGDSVRWKKEFDAAQGSTPWPFTNAIDRWAVGLRAARTWLPILGGAFFLLALFWSAGTSVPFPPR